MFVKFLALLRELEPNRHFLKLWLSQLLSLTAFNMVNFTLLLRVYDLTSSATFVSFFVLSFGLPSLFFGAIAGVFADRWNRRRVLVVTNLLRTVVVLVYLPALNYLPTIYAATFVMATITQFFTPAEGALIPELVDRKRLVAANAMFMLTMFGSFVIGYGVAGPLAAAGGDRLPITLGAVMFGLATLACLALPRSAVHGAAVGLRAAYRSVFSQLREGFRLALRSPGVRYGLAQMTFIWSTIGVIMVIVPIFTAQVLGLNLREVSRLIILPIGVGMLFGGYVLHRAKQQFKVRTIVAVSLFAAGLAVIMLGQIHNVAQFLIDHNWVPFEDVRELSQGITSIGSTLLGLALAMVMIAAQTLIHENTEPHVRGRVFGVLGTSVNAANTVPVLAAGALTDIFHVTAVITAIGVLLIGWSVTSPAIGHRQ